MSSHERATPNENKHKHAQNHGVVRKSGSEKGVLWKRGHFRKVHFLETLENLEILEFLENPQTVENKGESDHFLEILENLEILEILRDSATEKTPFVMTPFSGPEKRYRGWA